MTVLSFLDKPLTALSLLVTDGSSYFPAIASTPNVIDFAGRFGSIDWGSSTSIVPSYAGLGSRENIDGLIAIQDQMTDAEVVIPLLRRAADTGYLYFTAKNNTRTYVAVDGKYVSVTLDSNDAIETLEITAVAIPEGTAYVNISEVDLMKLIGAPRSN